MCVEACPGKPQPKHLLHEQFRAGTSLVFDLYFWAIYFFGELRLLLSTTRSPRSAQGETSL